MCRFYTMLRSRRLIRHLHSARSALASTNKSQRDLQSGAELIDCYEISCSTKNFFFVDEKKKSGRRKSNMNSVDFNSLNCAIIRALFTLRIMSSCRLLVYPTELRYFSVISRGLKCKIDNNSCTSNFDFYLKLSLIAHDCSIRIPSICSDWKLI